MSFPCISKIKLPLWEQQEQEPWSLISKVTSKQDMSCIPLSCQDVKLCFNIFKRCNLVQTFAMSVERFVEAKIPSL